MKYIELLLKRQAQMAARLEEQNAPSLRLHPDQIWTQTPQNVRAMEEGADERSVGISQDDASADVYRQLTRLEAIHEQSLRAVYRPEADLHPSVRSGMQEDAIQPLMQDRSGSAQEIRPQAFGVISENRTPQYSMERISRFFERDARRYGG